MPLIVLGSAKGSPGVTTTALACALAWPLRDNGQVVVVEADAAGSDLAAGFLRGSIGPEAGLAAVAADRDRTFPQAAIANAIALDETGSRLLLPGLPGAGQPLRLDDVLEPWAAWAASNAEVTILVDAGRLGSTVAGALFAAADVVALVVGSSLRSVAASRPTVRRLLSARDGRPAGHGVVAVVVGERRPYTTDEVATGLCVPVVGSMAWDPANAAVLSDGEPMTRRFARSALMRSASVVARGLSVAAATDTSIAAGRVGESGISSVAGVARLEAS